MKRTLLILLAAAVAVFSLIIFCGIRPSVANPGSFDGVMPFTTSEGLIGFFDQKDGKIYIYDGSLTHCMQVAQVEEFGRPMKILEKGF